MSNIIKVLGIESSCDDSGAAIVTSKREILSNIVISQREQHELYQGVVPEIAARAHMQNLRVAIEKATRELGSLDAIAATSGPGLIGGVIVGCMIGKALASTLKKPFIAVNHLEGHVLTARLTHQVAYPFLLLLISGGHCQFIQVESLGRYKILGQTLDDAVGEAFDKVGKMMGLGFPGGPEIEKLAHLGDPYRYELPRPLLGKPGCDMSFSGLKTAVRLLITNLGKLSEQNMRDIAASFQRVTGEVLIAKLKEAMKMYEYYTAGKTVVLAGGVAANQFLRQALADTAEQQGFNFIAPPVNLCTDNAAMIAWAGVERLQNGFVNSLEFSPRARWSLEELAR